MPESPSDIGSEERSSDQDIESDIARDIENDPPSGIASDSLSDIASDSPSDIESEGDIESNRNESGSEDYSRPTVQCGPDCPLRKPYILTEDPPLPVASASLPFTREEACAQLYSPIQPWQTRLLVVDPAEFGTSISASLFVVDVVHLSGAVLHERQQHVQFEALSYTWGAAIFPRSMTINAVKVPVTENLYAFVQRYRSSHKSSYLWVDALCINQCDLEEKAKQVSQMLAIYEKAHTVVVWLGEVGRNTKLAADYLRWANKTQLDGLRTVGERGLVNDTRLMPKLAKPDREGHAEECLHLVPQVLNGIEDICSRNWIRRIWVKQEIWAAKRLIVHCGTSQLTWSEYVNGPDVIISPTATLAKEHRQLIQDRLYYNSRPNIPSDEASCLQNLRTRDVLSRLPRGASSDNLNIHEILKLLNESIDCQSTNTHDRIYALMGMAGVSPSGDQADHAGSAVAIDVDYSISMASLYQRLAKSIMLYAGPFSILATDGIFGARAGIDFPSWTPDFRHPTRCKLPESYRPGYAASHTASHWVEDKGEIRRFRDLNHDPVSPILFLKGTRIAKITEAFASPYEGNIVPIIPTASYYLGGSHGPIGDHPFLVARSAEPIGWVQDEIEKGFGLKALSSYIKKHAAFAVSTESCAGDIVALVETVGVPLVLRPIEHKQGSFKFVSCAWLFYKPSYRYRAFMRYPQPTEQWENGIRRELTSVLPMFEDRPEVFRIE